MNKNKLVLSIAILLFAVGGILFLSTTPNAAMHTKEVQQEFLDKELLAEQLLKIALEEEQAFLSQLLKNETRENPDIGVFVVQEDSVVYWNSDDYLFSVKQLRSSKNLLSTASGAFYKLQKKKEGKTAFALILLKRKYPYVNRFLKNYGNKDIRIGDDFEVGEAFESTILNNTGEKAFTLRTTKQEASTFSWIIYLLFTAATILLLVFCFKCEKSWLAILVISLFRFLALFTLPEILSFSDLFSFQNHFKSLYLPTVGDLLLWGIYFFSISYFLRSIKHNLAKYVSGFFALFFCYFIVWLIDVSILHSNVNVNLNNILELNVFGYVVYISLALLFLALINAIDHFTLFVFKHKKSLFVVLLSVAILLALCFTLKYALPFIALSILLLLFCKAKEFENKKSVWLAMLVLAYIAALTSLASHYFAEKKEDANQKIILQKLAEEKDIVAEQLFEGIQQKLFKDTIAKQLFEQYWLKQKEVENYLTNTYFNGYWKKYNINFTACQTTDSLYISSSNSSTSCFDYFQDRIMQEGNTISSNNIFSLKSVVGQIGYIAQIPIATDSTNLSLFVEFNTNLFSLNEGYPELLLDEKSKLEGIALADYSYGVYNNGTLSYKYGNYNYSSDLKISELSVSSFYKYFSERFEHIAFQRDKDIAIVLSTEKINWFNYLTTWIYLLLIFSIVFSFVSFGFKSFPFQFKLIRHDFTSRVQILLVGSLLLMLVLFTVGTTTYIKKQYAKNNYSNISEKLRSVNIELENKIGNNNRLTEEDKNYIESLLVKFSNVFYTDINLYLPSGELYASSRKEVFDKGLKSMLVQPDAYRFLTISNKTEWVQEETIGNLNYLSAYVPFKNFNNKTIAYLNLPYFAKQGELQQEISTFLVSTFNIYVLVFMISLLISILFINKLTKPLMLIREQISELKFGKSVELIKWDSKDEIGSLVREYNRMILKLKDSADLLAKSERESAWREMAKQVAHEIKNPLTPMKLNIQHLQHAVKQGASDIDERMERTANSLIEQIDALANIASEFSHFAKMPETSSSKINLIDSINAVINLYSEENISFESVLEEAIVSADKDQLIRLFNNLIKNAIQAGDPEKSINIGISLKLAESEYIVEVKDDGVGISKNNMEQIFEPSFTTKSSGTGIGLAMCKSIMEQMGGTIKLESTINSGTTFFLTFPNA